MPQIQLTSVTHRFQGPPLLDGVDCVIEAGDRIGLLGRNGAGKTTLMKLLSGQLTPDHGEVTLASGTRVAQLRQDVPTNIHARVAEVVRQGVTAQDHAHAWEADQAVEKTLSRMGLAGDAEFQGLSSGMKRRVLLAQAIVDEPEVLLLDEPTNH
ncbi:MAG: ABC-F family ATP-binding cassette domain-containing protein, partial [Anaerolineae bacterium]|nr:ABC-F family ATP-binding cassette domain-containing protein [Anaerolineae bacterium]